jgi:hypothetical protein
MEKRSGSMSLARIRLLSSDQGGQDERRSKLQEIRDIADELLKEAGGAKRKEKKGKDRMERDGTDRGE